MAKTTERSNPKILFEGNKIGILSVKKDINQINKGAWTTEEDKKLAEVIAIHGAKRWKTIATIAGLNRCGKSCRLRWLNYLRPNIKRGNISDQEEDLILRLHKLLGNRWSLIAGRLPGRTDNEIKNYWNSHLSKKINNKDNKQGGILGIIEISPPVTRSDQQNEDISRVCDIAQDIKEKETNNNNNYIYVPKGISSTYEDSLITNSRLDFDFDKFFDFSDEGPLNMEWLSEFLEL